MTGKMNIKTIGSLLLTFVMLFTFSACNDEDDVLEIFNGKTWKLTRLTTEGSKRQFYEGLWGSEKEEETSRDRLKLDGNFVLDFNLANVNGETTGTAEAHGFQASINNARVVVDGNKRTISITGKVSGSEKDQLGRAFINGLPNVFKYEGDSNSLTLYFKDGNTTKVMGFAAQ